MIWETVLKGQNATGFIEKTGLFWLDSVEFNEIFSPCSTVIAVNNSSKAGKITY
jgi:hypothetical protein